jgi:hypothetical protein
VRNLLSNYLEIHGSQIVRNGERENLKKMFIGIGVFIALLGIWFIWGYLEGEKALREGFPQISEGPGQIVALAMDFGDKYSRWPKNIAELQKFVKDNKEKGDFDLTAYENITFTETSKKTLEIHYDSYKKGAISIGSTDTEIKLGP